MGERPQHPYICMCKGCPNGYKSTFYSAPPEWFMSQTWFKGEENLPKNCPDCRAWKNSQTDEARHCTGCGHPIRNSAKYKITFHMKQGPWVPALECQRCQLGRKIGKKAFSTAVLHSQSLPKAARSPKKLKRKLRSAGYKDPTYREFIADPAAYDTIPQHQNTNQTRKQHIVIHAAWTPPVPKKSKVAFGMPDGNFAALLRDVDLLAQESNPQIAQESQQGDRVIKVDLSTGDQVILRIEDEGPPPIFSLITAYNLLSKV